LAEQGAFQELATGNDDAIARLQRHLRAARWGTHDIRGLRSRWVAQACRTRRLRVRHCALAECCREGIVQDADLSRDLTQMTTRKCRTSPTAWCSFSRRRPRQARSHCCAAPACCSSGTWQMGVSKEDALFPALQNMLQDESVLPSALDAIRVWKRTWQFHVASHRGRNCQGARARVERADVRCAITAARGGRMRYTGRYLVTPTHCVATLMPCRSPSNPTFPCARTMSLSRVANEDIEVLAGMKRYAVRSGCGRYCSHQRVRSLDLLSCQTPHDCLAYTRWHQLGVVSLETWEPALWPSRRSPGEMESGASAAVCRRDEASAPGADSHHR
jgi:hypothetical protein